MVEPILLAVTRVATLAGPQQLTNATGFFFERDQRLFLVTSRHVVRDDPSGHAPDRLEITLHTDLEDLTREVRLPVPLYRDGQQLWRQGLDSGGEIDVAAIAIEDETWPAEAVIRALTPAHIYSTQDHIEIGDDLMIIGFPLGFQDDRHHLAVARRATVASSFGLRFQGQGYFLSDARMHRGTSGSPVVMRWDRTRVAGPREAASDMPWRLLGIHSMRLDVGTRTEGIDEALGLNCAWYADILMTLTET